MFCVAGKLKVSLPPPRPRLTKQVLLPLSCVKKRGAVGKPLPLAFCSPKRPPMTPHAITHLLTHKPSHRAALLQVLLNTIYFTTVKLGEKKLRGR